MKKGDDLYLNDERIEEPDFGAPFENDPFAPKPVNVEQERILEHLKLIMRQRVRVAFFAMLVFFGLITVIAIFGQDVVLWLSLVAIAIALFEMANALFYASRIRRDTKQLEMLEAKEHKEEEETIEGV